MDENWEIVKRAAQSIFQGKEREMVERLIDSFQKNELSFARIFDGLETIGDLKLLADHGYEWDALKKLLQSERSIDLPEPE
ncbi:MAG TPA: hypothetical protein VFV38_09875 [Ktedonobacteraceae bacterium]|nr:hypothetical protein [Ktedonobacteraceae bacterium]